MQRITCKIFFPLCRCKARVTLAFQWLGPNRLEFLVFGRGSGGEVGRGGVTSNSFDIQQTQPATSNMVIGDEGINVPYHFAPGHER